MFFLLLKLNFKVKKVIDKIFPFLRKKVLKTLAYVEKKIRVEEILFLEICERVILNSGVISRK